MFYKTPEANPGVQSFRDIRTEGLRISDISQYKDTNCYQKCK
jgi:hypothetical protein